MKQAKFRVWCNDKNEWEKDIVFLTPEGALFHYGAPGALSLMSLRPGKHTVEFFTGLKDKNGKEIYEGDRLFLEHYDPWIVDWSDGGFVVYNESNPDFVEYPLTQSMAEIREVIGNIHEKESK